MKELRYQLLKLCLRREIAAYLRTAKKRTESARPHGFLLAMQTKV